MGVGRGDAHGVEIAGVYQSERVYLSVYISEAALIVPLTRLLARASERGLVVNFACGK